MAALTPGAVFAGYTIERLLGAGGMGEVYAVRHPRLPRSDALKVLAAQFGRDDNYRRRFEREADLAASLSHPGIVAVHDRGETEGRLWIALALIDGTDLSAALRAAPGGFAAAEVARAVTEVADALDYAGARGLIHRDVKPANILLARTGHYLLTDFGIARRGPENSDLTGTGMTLGTIAYASPEQMRGLPVDARSDQYSLGVTAFHLLTGAQPFTGTNPVAVIMAHAQQPVPTVRTRRPDLAPAVDAVLARAMAKSPEHRFPTSRDFAAALAAALREPVPRLAPTAVHPNRLAATTVNQAPAGRRSFPRAAWLVLAVVALLALGALGLRAWWPDAGAEEAARLPRLPVTPIMPSLAERPAAPVWTLPGNLPPGARPAGVSALGGDADVALFHREYYPGSGSRVSQLEIVDAKTGQPRAAPIPVDDEAGRPLRCVVAAESAACALDADGAPVDAVLFLDLAAARVTATLPSAGRIVRLLAAGDRFVLLDRTERQQQPGTVRSFSTDGRELPPIARTGTPQDRDTLDVFEKAGLAVFNTAPDPAQPLANWEFRVIRLADGREIYRRATAERLTDRNWNVFVAGFVVDDGESPAAIHDADGTRTADLPEGWRPSVRPTLGTEPVETSVPTAIRTSKGKTTYAGIGPDTGTVLWKQDSYGIDDSPGTVPLRGVGTLLFTSDDNGRVVDAYTGDYVIPGVVGQGTVLGTDGTRVAVTRSTGGRHRLEVWSGDGEVWHLESEQPPVAIAGKIYIGDIRLV